MWKDIKGFEGLYQVSDEGQVRSLNYRGSGKIRELTPQVRKDGYLAVTFSVNGTRNYFLVHRLVAEAFVPNPEGLPQVSHLDESHTNNKAINLAWATGKTNCNMPKHKERLFDSSISKKCKPVYCWEEDKTYDSIAQAARELGVCSTAVAKCCSGYSLAAKGYHFEFAA